MDDKKETEVAKDFIQTQYKKLDSMRYSYAFSKQSKHTQCSLCFTYNDNVQKQTMFASTQFCRKFNFMFFILLAVLWLTRKCGKSGGWGVLFKDG